MKQVCLQAGHSGVYTGATGAPGERDWNEKVVPKISAILKERGIEVYEVAANADDDSKTISTDWDLFLAIHYDADIYSDRGGFVDTPDPDSDFATTESNRIAQVIRDNYFKRLGIPNKPKRSNANTQFYYMWSALTAKTPCAIIECGVGWRKEEDYNTLWNRIDEVALAIADGISEALGVAVNDHTQQVEELILQIDKLNSELIQSVEGTKKIKEKLKAEEKDHTKTKEALDKVKDMANSFEFDLSSKNTELEVTKRKVESLRGLNGSQADTIRHYQNKLYTWRDILRFILYRIKGGVY